MTRKGFRSPKNKKGKRFKIDDLTEPPNYDLSRPIFSFKHMKYQKHCCISMCGEDEKSFIIDTLLRFSQLTWREIKRLPKQAGFEKMPSYRFKVALPKILTPEVSILVARYDGKGGRIAGFRNKDVYHVVLAGKNLYPHYKIYSNYNSN